MPTNKSEYRQFNKASKQTKQTNKVRIRFVELAINGLTGCKYLGLPISLVRNCIGHKRVRYGSTGPHRERGTESLQDP